MRPLSPHSGKVRTPSDRHFVSLLWTYVLCAEHLSPTSHTPVQTQSAVPTPTNTHRRTRSSSLPIAADVATERAKARRRRGAKNSVDWSSSSSPSSPNATQSNSHVTPLSQFQLLTLHQLNLPRPAFLSSNSSSRLWGHAAPKRNFNGSHSSQSSTASNLYTPSLSPPIGLATLKELDLGEILRNPQLRHDIVFDPVSFIHDKLISKNRELTRQALPRTSSFDQILIVVQEGRRKSRLPNDIGPLLSVRLLRDVAALFSAIVETSFPASALVRA